MAMIDRLGLVEKGKVAAGLIVLVALVGATGCGGIIDLDGNNGSPKKKQVAGKENDAKPN